MKYITFIPVFLILGLHLYFLTNLQFTAWPEMFTYSYLRNNGYLLYQDMIHPYPPILTMFLSLVYKSFGYSEMSLKVVSWSISMLSSILIYLCTLNLTKSRLYALAALLLFVISQPFLEGNMLWFDNAIVFPVLLGLYSLIRYVDKKTLGWLIISGLSLSLAALIKQTAALYLIFIFVFLFVNKENKKNLLLLLISPFVFLIPLFVRLLQENSLTWFINWTVVNPLLYWSDFPNYVQMAISKRNLFIISLLTIPSVLLLFLNLKSRKNKTNYLILIFLLVSLVSVYPRFSFFHFQAALAVLVIMWIVALSKFNIKMASLLYLSMFIFVLSMITRPAVKYLWHNDVRFAGKDDYVLASIIKNKVSGEKVFLQGLNSSLYAFSDTLPPKPWTDNFGWYLEIPNEQKYILEKWEKDPPKYIFWRKPSMGNWYDLGTYEPKEFVEYYKLHYNFIEEVVPGVELWQRKS